MTLEVTYSTYRELEGADQETCRAILKVIMHLEEGPYPPVSRELTGVGAGCRYIAIADWYLLYHVGRKVTVLGALQGGYHPLH